MADPSRPLKRPRKNDDSPPPQLVPAQPVDHIFIADGLLNKKPGGKKAPLSCCECRRLKLKCDRNFPCASCKKRGCAEICPDGVLVSGKGTRFILANTEQLHAKIQEMSDRIRHLEDSIRASNPDSSLLAPELLPIKSTMGLYSSNGQTTHPTPSVGGGDDGKKLSNGSAGGAASTSEDGQKGRGDCRTPAEDHTPAAATMMQVDDGGGISSSCIVKSDTSLTLDLTAIHSNMHNLTHSFPLPSYHFHSPTSEQNLAMREHIRSQLPPRAEAQRLWDQARRNALWQYNPHPSATFFPLLLHHIYSSSSSSSTSDEDSPKPVKDVDPRRLALLFMILSVACIVDVSGTTSSSPDLGASSSGSPPQSPHHHPHHHPVSSTPSPSSTTATTTTTNTTLHSSFARATRYHALGRAALCEIPIMEETNVETVLALFYEIWFLAVWSDGKKAVGEAWGIMGLVAKLAQSIGLHRNGGKSKVIPEEVGARRALFWELLYLDARLSLSLGRPPSLSIHHMDCPRPSYAPDEQADFGEASHHWQAWKHSCYQHCLVPVLDAISKPGLEYSKVIDLDRSIRDFSIPASLRNREKLNSRSLVLQRASLGTALEAVLLQLHRSYFIRSLSGPEEAFNRRHKYAPSVVAVFLGASRMIATVHELFQREPELTARVLWYWSNAFSAAIALCLLVSRAPFTCLSPATLQELERARLLFRSGKDICPKASQVLPVLETMVDKANDIYRRWANGQEIPTIVLRHITEDGTGETDDTTDRRSPAASAEDPFSRTHSSLAQCIAEVHQIAHQMFPMRKPCNCSNRAVQDGRGTSAGSNSAGGNGNNAGSNGSAPVVSCPPSHEWSPPPIINSSSSPVLPDAPIALGMYARGNGASVGYTPSTYHNSGTGANVMNGGGRMGDTAGAYSSSSLKGSGMSPSPSPGIGNNNNMYHQRPHEQYHQQKPMAGGVIGSSQAFGQSPAGGGVSATLSSPSTYSGYSNGGGGAMYSPTATSSHGTPYQASSPAFRSTASPPAHPNTNAMTNIAGPAMSSSGTGLYTSSIAVMPSTTRPVTIPSYSPTTGVGDAVTTINFDVGALSANNDQSFMVFY